MTTVNSDLIAYLVGGIAGACVLALALSLVWVVLLRRSVRQRTQALQDELNRCASVEATLRVQQANLLALIENTDGSIWSVDRNYRLITGNSAFQQSVRAVLGRELAIGENVLGSSAAETVNAEWQSYYDRALAGEHFSIETQRRLIEPAIWVEYRFSPIRDQAGAITGATVFGRDSSERRRAETELRASEEHFRLAFENASDGVCLVGLDGRLLRVNAQMCEMFGYGRQEMEGMSVNDFTHPDYKNVSPQFIRRAIETDGSREEFEKCYIHRNGSLVWGRVSSSLIHDEQGMPLYFISHVQDITERKQAEAERAKLQEQLVQAQKMESIGRLAGGIAHDFNNMLAVILMRAEMSLAVLEDGSPIQRSLLAIQSAAQRSAELVRQLLGFARKQVIAPRVLDLNDTLATLTPMLRTVAGAEITLILQPGAELWPVKIDPSQLNQIMTNLVLNSRDAIDAAGVITITTQNVMLPLAGKGATAPPGDYVMLAVADDGCGMSAEVLAHVFEPFFTTKEIGKGVGLGLAMIDGIVQQNHGCIEVSSAPGRGATFEIFLPRVLAPAPTSAAKTRTPGSATNTTILLVEDNPEALEMAHNILSQMGYRVIAATTPSEALQLAAIHTTEIDLLMTDIIAPEMDGTTLAARIADLCPGVKQLFISGFSAETIARGGDIAPETRHLEKPFSQQ